MRILIIEDNIDIVANLYAFLEPRGHVLDTAASGYAGLALLSEGAYDAIVLDVSLPGLNGIELCRHLRKEMNNPTRDTVADKVAGFDSGADDYLVKPFSMVELEVRLKALVRRASGRLDSGDILSVADLQFNVKTYSATRGTRRLQLTRTGYLLLARLMRSSPALVTRDELEHAVWGDDRPESDALRTHIHALRQALDKGEPVPLLHTISGIGYQLCARDEKNDTV